MSARNSLSNALDKPVREGFVRLSNALDKPPPHAGPPPRSTGQQFHHEGPVHPALRRFGVQGNRKEVAMTRK